MVRSKEGFGESDAAGVGVVEVEIGFEKFFGIRREMVLHAGGSEVVNRA